MEHNTLTFITPRISLSDAQSEFRLDEIVRQSISVAEERMLRMELSLDHLKIDLADRDRVMVLKSMFCPEGSRMVGFDLGIVIRLKKTSETGEYFICREILPYTTAGQPDFNQDFSAKDLLEIRAVQRVLSPAAEFDVKTETFKDEDYIWAKIVISLLNLNSTSYITEVSEVFEGPPIPALT